MEERSRLRSTECLLQISLPRRFVSGRRGVFLVSEVSVESMSGGQSLVRRESGGSSSGQPPARLSLSSTGLPRDAEEPQVNFEDYLLAMIERERRQWDDERAKLKYCIFLQEQELNEKAAAAEERAGQIAGEFRAARQAAEERVNDIMRQIHDDIRDLQATAEQIYRRLNFNPKAKR